MELGPSGAELLSSATPGPLTEPPAAVSRQPGLRASWAQSQQEEKESRISQGQENNSAASRQCQAFIHLLPPQHWHPRPQEGARTPHNPPAHSGDVILGPSQGRKQDLILPRTRLGGD